MATNQQNINIGTADNANDGDVLRAAFRKVRKMFAEIYGDTDAENLTDTETVPATSFDTHITEKIEDTVGAMFAGGTQTNVTVTYDDSDGSIDLNVAADITDVNAGAGLTGTNEAGGAATLNVIGGDGITVGANEVEVAVDDATIELSASDGSGAVRVKDNGIGYAKLDDEFTTSTAIAASAVDFSSAAVFTKTLTANTTLTFSNVSTGMVKTLVISGDFTLTFPSGVKTLNGTYSGTATNNVIQLISTNGSTDIFATISNYTA